jgi:hypothetical protein
MLSANTETINVAKGIVAAATATTPSNSIVVIIIMISLVMKNSVLHCDSDNSNNRIESQETAASPYNSNSRYAR